MSMTYLFNSKEPGVLEYIGNKLFTFSNDEVFQLKSVCITFSTPISLQVDFYLPQLINMYIMLHAVAEVIHPYLIARWESHVVTTRQYYPNVYEDNYYPLLFGDSFLFSDAARVSSSPSSAPGYCRATLGTRILEPRRKAKVRAVNKLITSNLLELIDQEVKTLQTHTVL